MSKGLDAFISIWTHPDYPPAHVTDGQLSQAEERLDQNLPQDYADAICRCGLPSPTAALLESITEQELDLHDVSGFFSPNEIIEQTKAWRSMGLPTELVAFADDCMGNLFCFESEQDARVRPESARVWFFDHDFQECKVISPSFETWIGSFGAIAESQS